MAEFAERKRASVLRSNDPVNSSDDPRLAVLQRRAAERHERHSRQLSSRDPGLAPRRGGDGGRGELPAALRSGIEALSGESMDGVKVHYNSAKPAQLGAFAYAQGRDIHVGPRQERHLPHEAWHLVQQAQGRVRPTLQAKGGVTINDDPGLEREADALGEKALRLGGTATQLKTVHGKGCGCSACGPAQLRSSADGAIVQLKGCKFCGYETGHAPDCTPEKRAAATAAAKSANAAAHDKSKDNRTRKDQSHPHHGNKNIKKAWK